MVDGGRGHGERSAGGERRDRKRLGAVVLAVLISQVLLYPGVPLLTVALGAPAGIDAGMWFLVAEFAAFVAFAVVWGAVSDALGRRIPLIVIGAFGGALAYVSLALIPVIGAGFEAALVVRAVGGAFTVGAFSLSITTLMDLRGGNGRNMGVAGLAIGLGAAVGSVGGGILADLGVFYPIYAGAGVLVLSGVLASTVSDTPARTGDIPGGDQATEARSPRARGVREALARVRAVPALLVPCAFGFIDRLTAGFFSLVGVFYFQDPATFGLSATGAGATLALFFIPFALLQAPFGAISDRIGRFYPIIGGSLAYGVAIIGVGLAPVYPVAAGLMVLVGVCGALLAPATMALVTDIIDPEARGAAMALFNVFGSLGFLTGFLVGGAATGAFGYRPAFLVVGGLELLIALALLPIVRAIVSEDGSPRWGIPDRS